MKMMKRKKAVLITVRRLLVLGLLIEVNHLTPTLETAVRPKGVSEARFLMMAVGQVEKMTEATILKIRVAHGMIADLAKDTAVEILVIREALLVTPVVHDETMVADIQEAQVETTVAAILVAQAVMIAAEAATQAAHVVTIEAAILAAVQDVMIVAEAADIQAAHVETTEAATLAAAATRAVQGVMIVAAEATQVVHVVKNEAAVPVVHDETTVLEQLNEVA